MLNARIREDKLKLHGKSSIGARVLRLEGRVHHTNAMEFTNELSLRTLCLAAKEALIIDFSELTSISSAGLRGLLTLKRDLDAAGKHYVFVGLSHEMELIFRVTRFDCLFPIASDIDTASRMISGDLKNQRGTTTLH
ncbi:MAG: STAS domain-containing protein [Pseudomonadota bacterium]